MWYIATLILILIIYVSIIFCMKFMKNIKLWNFIFFAIIYLSYLALVLKIYFDVGFYDWNFQNTLPVANVSPFMFATLPVFYILPKKIKKYHMSLISLLSVGMLLANAFNCIYFASINYAFHYHFLFDYLAHLTLSLWGIYFIKSNQLKVEKKEALIGSSIIIIVAIIMLILNVVFDTSFFGLSLTGKHNIYNNVIVSNSYLSALIYFAGLSIVLLLGYVLIKIISRKRS